MVVVPFNLSSAGNQTNDQPFASPRHESESSSATQASKVNQLAITGVLENVDLLHLEYIKAMLVPHPQCVRGSNCASPPNKRLSYAFTVFLTSHPWGEELMPFFVASDRAL